MQYYLKVYLEMYTRISNMVKAQDFKIIPKE